MKSTNSYDNDIFVLRFLSNKKIVPISFFVYDLDLSKTDKDTEKQKFFNIMCRHLNVLNPEYYAVNDDEYIYTYIPVKSEDNSYTTSFDGKDNYLLIKNERKECIDISNKKVYEEFIKLCIITMQLGKKHSFENKKYEWSGTKIISKYIPIFAEGDYKNATYVEIGTELYKLQREYTTKVYMKDTGYFCVCVNMCTTIEPQVSILDLHRQGKKIEGIRAFSETAKYTGRKADEGIVCLNPPDKMKEEYKTVDGLLDYFKNQHRLFLKKISDDFVVYLKDKRGKKLSFLASKLSPVYNFQQIKNSKPDGVKDIRSYLLLDMKTRMKEACLFLDDLPELPQLNNVSIVRNQSHNFVFPMRVSECGFNFFVLDPPKLKIKHNDRNVPISVDKKFLIFSSNTGYHPYRLPLAMRKGEMIRIVVISMTKFPVAENLLKRCTERIVSESIVKLYPRDHFEIIYCKFDSKVEHSEIDFAKKIKSSYNPRLILAVVNDTRGVYNRDNAEDDLYPEMKEAFADNLIAIPSQMFAKENTFSMYMKEDPSKTKFISQNICLGILGKLGGMPYTLSENPWNIDLYIGLDVGATSMETRIPCCAAAFIGNGDFIGVIAPRDYTRREIIPNDILKKIFDRLISQFKEIIHRYPKNIVIHRDGFLREDMTWISRYFSEQDMKFQVVEIRKHGAEFFCDRHDPVKSKVITFNPKPGSGIYDTTNKEVSLITSTAKSGGAPNPIIISNKGGTLGLDDRQVTEQVFWLTKIDDATLNDTRLPITIRYADKISKNPKFIPMDKVVVEKYFI